MKRIGLLFFATATLAAQPNKLPYAENFGPLYSIEKTRISQPTKAHSVRDINFRNLWVYEPDGVRLKNGKFERRNAAGFEYESIELDSVYYLAAYSLILYRVQQCAGSCTNGSIASVFRLAAGQLDLVQQITWDADALRGSQGLKSFSFDEQAKNLVIRSSHYLPGDSHAQISAIDVVTLAWRDTHFEKIAERTDLSDPARARENSH